MSENASNPRIDLAWQIYLHNRAPLSSREYDVARAAFIAAWHAALSEGSQSSDETSADLKAENDALRQQIVTIEGWNDNGTAEWAQMTYEQDLLVHRVIAECEALRLGVGISYAYWDDPVVQLKRRMPSVEQITVAHRAVTRHLASSPKKAKGDEA